MFKFARHFVKMLYLKLKFFNKKVIFSKKSRAFGETYFEGHNYLGPNTVFSGYMGYGSYIGENARIYGKIGRYCSIGPNVNVVQGQHPSKTFVSSHPAFYSSNTRTGLSFVKESLFEENKYAEKNHSVVINNDVWIGYGATILEGITIGDGAIIAAGAVVTKDVEPYTVVGGIPAKPIRKRFDDDEIEFLIQLKWWNFTKDQLLEVVPFFKDVKVLKEYFNKR